MPQGVGYGMGERIDGDPFPNMVRDRDQLSQLWIHIAEVLSDGVRQKAMEEQAGPVGLPDPSQWAGADARLREDPGMMGDGMDAAGYRYSDGQIVPFASEGMPTRNTLAREFRIGDNQIAQFALQAGFTREQAVIATAIALAESLGSTAAVGDATITDGTYGPSLGLWQIRTMWTPPASGMDSFRDHTRLFDPAFNAQAAYAISRQGQNWNAWTDYKNDKYRQFLGRAQRAVDDALAAGQIEGMR